MAYDGIQWLGLAANAGTGSLTASAQPTAKMLSKVSFKTLQHLSKVNSRAINEFLKSNGKTAVDRQALEIYKELATRILNGTGGAPAKKASQTAIKVQPERLRMISNSLNK